MRRSTPNVLRDGSSAKERYTIYLYRTISGMCSFYRLQHTEHIPHACQIKYGNIGFLSIFLRLSTISRRDSVDQPNPNLIFIPNPITQFTNETVVLYTNRHFRAVNKIASFACHAISDREILIATTLWFSLRCPFLFPPLANPQTPSMLVKRLGLLANTSDVWTISRR